MKSDILSEVLGRSVLLSGCCAFDVLFLVPTGASYMSHHQQTLHSLHGCSEPDGSSCLATAHVASVRGCSGRTVRIEEQRTYCTQLPVRLTESLGLVRQASLAYDANFADIRVW